jgi:hypothetical protein
MPDPNSDQLRQEYLARQQELRALRRLLEMTRAREKAAEAKKAREAAATGVDLSLNETRRRRGGGDA